MPKKKWKLKNDPRLSTLPYCRHMYGIIVPGSPNSLFHKGSFVLVIFFSQFSYLAAPNDVKRTEK